MVCMVCMLCMPCTVCLVCTVCMVCVVCMVCMESKCVCYACCVRYVWFVWYLWYVWYAWYIENAPGRGIRWGGWGPAHHTYISKHLRSNTAQSQCTIRLHRHSAKKYCTTTLQRHMALNRRQPQPMSFELQINRKRNGQRATKRNLNHPLAYKKKCAQRF